MSDVEFVEEQIQKSDFQSRRLLGDYTTPATASLLMRLGLAKTPRGAYYMMIGITVACFVLAILILYFYVIK